MPGILGEHVTLEQGTGIVHTAPGHGAEDFAVGQEYGIETYAPLDDDGRFVEGLPEYKGKTVFEANPAVIALLKSRGNLVAEGKLQHSYPHCWRCHNPVIFRATEQWFIHLGAARRRFLAPKAPPLRARALEVIDEVQWTPSWGHERIHDMIAERSDWCISRQRFWGVPITVFYCDGCRALLDDAKTLRHVLPFFEKEGADAWYTHSAEELLPPGTRCAKCGQSRWRKETDILDVWFDSGSTHLAVLDPPGTPAPELPWPADLYLEGPDQYRGWFQSSLLIGVGVHGRAPYKHVLTHGWTLDEQGRPMSKSLGNVVLPTEICDKWGADLLRLWVASQDYTADVRMSDNVMTQLSEAYRKIRNTFRFAAGNLADFDPQRDALPDDATLGDRSLDADAHRGTGPPVPPAVRLIRVSPRLPRPARFLRRGPERLLLRRAQGPPVHLRPAQSRPPLGADRHLPHRQRADPPARAHHGLHHRGNLEASAARRQSRREHSPGAASAGRRDGHARRTRASATTGTNCSSFAAPSWFSSKPRATNKTIGGSLEAKVLLNGANPEAPLWKQVRRLAAGALHRLAGGNRRARRSRQERRGLPRRSRTPTAPSASAAGTIRRASAKAPTTRPSASAASRRWPKSSAPRRPARPPDGRGTERALAVARAGDSRGRPRHQVRRRIAAPPKAFAASWSPALPRWCTAATPAWPSACSAARMRSGFPFVLLLVSGGVVLLLAWLLFAGRAGRTLAGAGLALLAGGAAGNLLDRLLHGAVTDFVELHAGSFYWPAFNLADSAITIGAALLVIELFRGDSRRAVAQE